MVELLFLLLPLAFLSGWQTAKKRYKKAQTNKRQHSDNLVKGINFLLSEEPDKALEVFISNPDVDEYTAETYLLLGNMFRNRGEVDRALKVHQNLISRPGLAKEQKTAAMLAYGEDFFAAGMLDRAESVFQELINANNGEAQACGTLRNIYEQTKDWDRAIEVSECESQKTGDDHSRLIAHYYCELASEELENGNIHLVEEYIKNARKSYTRSTRVLVLEGDLELRRNNYAGALKKYQKAIAIDPRLLGLLDEQLIKATTALGGTDRLISYLQKLLAKNSDSKVLEYLLDLSLRQSVNDKQQLLIEEEIKKSDSVRALLGVVKLWKLTDKDTAESGKYDVIEQVLGQYLRQQAEFQCQHCGYKMNDFLWRCPACHHWDTVS